VPTNAYPGPRPDRATAQRKREAALARLTRVRALTIAGAGALTAVVAGVVSSASGHTLGASHAIRTAAVTPRAASARSKAVGMPPLANARQLGLRRPSASPQPVPQQDPNAQAQAAAPQAAAPQPVAPQSVAPQAAAPQPVAPQPAPAPAVSGGS
jgi:hypothetical protein